MSNRVAGAPETLLPIAARIGDERVSFPVTWSSLAIEQETLVCSRRQSHAQPIIPPDLREKPRSPVNSDVEAIEKGSANNLQKKRPPYLTFKRRSRIGRPFGYPQFGHFCGSWDLSTAALGGIGNGLVYTC